MGHMNVDPDTREARVGVAREQEGSWSDAPLEVELVRHLLEDIERELDPVIAEEFSWRLLAFKAFDLP